MRPGLALHRLRDGEAKALADLFVRKAFWIEEAIEREAVERGGELRRDAPLFGGGRLPELRHQLIDLGHTAAQAHGGVEVGEATALARVAYGVELKFEVQQPVLPVAHELREAVCEGVDPLLGGGGGAEFGVDVLLVAVEVLLEDGEEDVFFVAEVAVEGAAGLSGFFGDVFDSGVFEAVLGKGGAGGLNELLAGGYGALLLGST